MSWKFRNDQQIWLQLSEIITRQIVSGKYPAGSRFPSVRELAAEAGVNPNTMQRALTALEDQSLLICHGNMGRFVTDDKILLEKIRQKIAFTEFSGLCERMYHLGLSKEETAALFMNFIKEERA